ncbi:NAD-dependent dehydratase [Sinomonas cellulolyticus]|uniref:NAD(P)H-binding protein n=1 Tax=Sinomonas cellulolyticus TaxID=2801916 RepID=A0ABS1JXU0_9MICC|nr:MULTISPECIES: NAD(P)H-binding protein [Sinomonas]MBL0704205.1 NAD(P)H-binding protein [Sinomonas cellulolyticus]GHG58260.1 NAD-dependent dehydratase [Sinomonas sp. KCTC 49339]
MSRIAIIGGHGKVALLLAPLLVERGDEVTSIIRNPDHAAEVEATGAAPVVADVETLDEAALAEILAGHDAVVWSAGAGGGNPARTMAVDRDAAIRSMKAAADAQVPRYLMVSYLGARPDHGVPESNPFFHYAEAKAAADEHLRGTSLDWTILGPSALTLDPGTGRIALAGPEDARSVSRADVAAVVAAALREPRTVHQFVGFNQGDTPIDEALASL